MSSLRNAVARRPHKERSQPKSREKWGLLEKHKDYSLRSKDYNQKKQKLSVLQQKSRDKNPDEFAFGMLSAGSAGQGKHNRQNQGNQLSHDAVKLLKTQDAGYLRTVAAQTRREFERVNQEIDMDMVMRSSSGGSGGGQKVVFDKERQPPASKKRRISHDVEVPDENHDSHLLPVDQNAQGAESDDKSDKQSKLRSKVISQKYDLATKMKAERKRRQRLQESRSIKLDALKKRQRDIMAVADELELQRAKMAKSVGGTNKNGMKFKIRERKR